MSRSKLTLPFSQACKLTTPQKCKLIECQARRVAIEEWEIQALLDVCEANGWADKGLAVLYEYADHLDNFKTQVEERSNCMEDVIDFVLGLSQQHGMLNIAELQAATQKAALLTVKTLHTLSFWRRLQCCPRPLYVEETQGGRWSFPFLLKDEAKRFSDALFQSMPYASTFELLGIEAVALLVAPFMDFDSFLDLVRYQQKYGAAGRQRAGRRQESGDGGRYDVESLQRPDCPVRLAFEAVREVIEQEDRLESAWQGLRALPFFRSDTSVEPSRLYPVLRLPYRSFKAPTEDLVWFQSAIPRYLQAEALLTAYGHSHLPGPAAVLRKLGTEHGAKKSLYNEEYQEDDAPNIADSRDRSGSPTEQTPVPSSSTRNSSQPYSPSPVRSSAAGPGPQGAAAGPGGFVRARGGGSSVKATPPPGARKAAPVPSPVVPFSPAAQDFDGFYNPQDSPAPRAAVPAALRSPKAYPGASPGQYPYAGPSPGPSPGQYYTPQHQQQHRPPHSPVAANMVLPSRGNNAEAGEMHYTGSSNNSFLEDETGSITALASGALAFPVDPSLRKRSVTVAVVGHTDNSAAVAKEQVDHRRRVTHAGMMSTSQSLQRLQPAQSLSAGASVVMEPMRRSMPELLPVREEAPVQDVVPAVLVAPQRAASPVLVPIIEYQTAPAGAPAEKAHSAPEPALMTPMVEARSPGGRQSPTMVPNTPVQLQLQSPAPTEANIATSAAEVSVVTTPASTATPAPILKQSSIGSDLGSLNKRPSQIVRAASESRPKTLSFDSMLDESGAGTPQSPDMSSRPRNGSYEIIYQESPEEARPQIVYQETPVPLNRKRSQSTPLNLMTAGGTSAPSSSGSTSIPFSPPVHVSPSLNDLFSSANTSSRASNAEARLRSAPAYPVRKTYRPADASSASPSPGRVRKHNSASRFFSARRREEGDEEPHFMETFGMLDTLSKPFTRGESLAESQILHIALRSMKVEGSTMMELAARKISIWWKLVAPRKMLLRRMARRDECRAIVLAMADSAVAIAITKQRRRRALLRSGAAMKIQRCFRHWCATILVEERRIEREERSAVAWRSLSVLCCAVKVAIRIYRYLRYCQRRRIIRRVTKINSAMMLQRTIEKYITLRTLRKKLDQQKELYTKMKVTSMMSSNTSRSNLYRERELACVCIQKVYRAYLLHKEMLQRQYFNIMGSKITYFFIRCIARRRVKFAKKKNAAAVVIQTFFRGLHTRARILKIVRSGLLLNSLWRKHKSYVSLKSQLRRVDRPHTLVIHGIRNIAKKTINSNQMRFKVSVWWHPLLHIVSQNDFNTIIQSKQPQFIYNSSNFYLVDTAEPRGNRRMSMNITQGLRKLSNMITTTASRRQSTLAAPGPAVGIKPTPGVFRYSQVLASRSNSMSETARRSMATVYDALTSRKGSNMSLPPIAGAGRMSRNSVLAPITSGAGASGTTGGPGAAAASPAVAPLVQQRSLLGMAMRKESVEVLRPSALAAQLDIIHSDEESEDSDDDEDQQDSPVPKSTGSGSGRSLPVRRSFLAQRMGLAPSPSTSDRASSPEKIAEGDEADGEKEEGGAGAEAGAEEKGGSGKAVKSWRRLSNVVLNSPDMLQDPVGNSAENSENGDNSSSQQHSPKPPSMTKKSRSSNAGSLFLRSTLNFMSLGASARGKSQLVTEPKMICHFEDTVVKIPGCHGNSVIKFEIFEGDRKYGNCHFYLNKEGEMMFWGGEYQRNVNLLQQRRAVQFNSHIINARNPTGAPIPEGGAGAGATAGHKRGASTAPSSANLLSNDEPILDFRVISGAALRSKCSWGRVAVRGSGPLKRLLKSRDFLSSFLFDKWHRFYFSLDEFGLHLFDNKFNTSALHVIPVADLKEVSVDVGAPIKQSSSDAAKNIVEDIHNVKIVTFSGDDLYMRFPDTSTRVAWQEALTNSIMQQKCVNSALAASRRAWVAKAVEGDCALKGRGVLATALSDEENAKASNAVVNPAPRGSFGSFTEGSGVSHIHRLLRLRTERALSPFVRGGGGSGIGATNGPLTRSATAPSASTLPGRTAAPEVKVIINNQRGSPGSLSLGRKQMN